MRLPNTRQVFAAAAATSALLMTAACGGGSDPAGEPTAPSSAATGGATSGSSTGTYADGTYEASASYPNPGGVSSVDVTLTLAGGKVSDVEVKPGAQGTSLQYQEKFISGIAGEVVGKSLDELDVSKVSGSSLTSQGFNAALEEIKSKASQA